MPRPAPIDWSNRVDRILTRWNRLGKPEAHREAVVAMTVALTEWSAVRNRLVGVVQALEKELSLEEHSQ
jgi:hypothetical protein